MWKGLVMRSAESAEGLLDPEEGDEVGAMPHMEHQQRRQAVRRSSLLATAARQSGFGAILRRASRSMASNPANVCPFPILIVPNPTVFDLSIIPCVGCHWHAWPWAGHVLVLKPLLQLLNAIAYASQASIKQLSNLIADICLGHLP